MAAIPYSSSISAILRTKQLLIYGWLYRLSSSRFLYTKKHVKSDFHEELIYASHTLKE